MNIENVAMNKKSQLTYKDSLNPQNRNSVFPSFLRFDPIDEERYAHQQEHQRK